LEGAIDAVEFRVPIFVVASARDDDLQVVRTATKEEELNIGIS
jgi:hypothetical protein